jgi:hypothetical protein
MVPHHLYNLAAGWRLDQIMEALAAGHNATVQMSKPFSPTWCTNST